MRRWWSPFLLVSMTVGLFLAVAARRRNGTAALPQAFMDRNVQENQSPSPYPIADVGADVRVRPDSLGAHRGAPLHAADEPTEPALVVKHRRLAFVGILALALIAPWFLPHQVASIFFVALVAGSFIAAGVEGRQAIYGLVPSLVNEIRRSLRRVHVAEDTLPALARRHAVAEIGLVVVLALSATSPFLNTDPGQKLPGGEAEWLTSSAYFASMSLHEYGFIPLWQPYLDYGEPLLDSPFSFVLNPFSAGPTLLFDGVTGIKLSVALYAALAGLGGWLLGRTLGFGALGRVLLGLLLICKGNMLAMIGAGYFQLGVTQAYFPWVIAGTLATLRNHGQRWPLVLLAVSFALLFTAGNIWYTLPTLIAVVLLAATHLLRKKLDGRVLGRLLLAGALTIGLAAMTLLPIWANRVLHTGMHPPEEGAGWVVDPIAVIAQYFTYDTPVYLWDGIIGELQFYHSFVAPPWFFAAAFVVLPLLFITLLKPASHRPSLSHPWRIWGVALFLLVVATVWGSGGNPIMVWLYEHIPLLREWRFVGRALAVGSFWLAVLLAARVDGLWQASLSATWRDWVTRLVPVSALRGVSVFVLVAMSGLAADHASLGWKWYAGTGEYGDFEGVCLAWLREQEPYRPLTVYRVGYDIIYSFLDNKIRLHDIEADYQALPPEWTLGHVDLMNAMPEYAFGWDTITIRYLRDNGYRPMMDSPRTGGRPCLYHKADALSFAFTVPTRVILTYRDMPVERTTPVTTLRHEPGRIWVWARGDSSMRRALVVQESAFPGWRVAIDGQPATLEIVGGMLSVIMPLDDTLHEITFEYRPPLLYLGAAITLASCAFCILYLLRADRLLPRRRG